VGGGSEDDKTFLGWRDKRPKRKKKKVKIVNTLTRRWRKVLTRNKKRESSTQSPPQKGIGLREKVHWHQKGGSSRPREHCPKPRRIARGDSEREHRNSYFCVGR